MTGWGEVEDSFDWTRGGGGGGGGLNVLVFNCRGYYMLKWLFVVWLYSHAVFVVCMEIDIGS